MSCQKTPYCSWLIVRPLTGPSKSHRHAEIGKPSALGWSWPCRRGRLLRLALGGGPPSDHRALIQSVDPGGRQGIYVLTFPVRNVSQGWCERYTKPSRWSALHLLPRGLQLLTAQRKTPGTPSSTRLVTAIPKSTRRNQTSVMRTHGSTHSGGWGWGRRRPPVPYSTCIRLGTNSRFCQSGLKNIEMKHLTRDASTSQLRRPWPCGPCPCLFPSCPRRRCW